MLTNLTDRMMGGKGRPVPVHRGRPAAIRDLTAPAKPKPEPKPEPKPKGGTK